MIKEEAITPIGEMMKKAYLTQAAVKWLLDNLTIYVTPNTGAFNAAAVEEIQFMMAVAMSLIS